MIRHHAVPGTLRALSFHDLPDSCRDAIFDTLDFLDARAQAPIALRDLHYVAMRAVKQDRDPSETALRARVLCRFGCLVGAVTFICRELEELCAVLEHAPVLAGEASATATQAHTAREALESACCCFHHLRSRDIPRAHRHFQQVQNAVARLRNEMPEETTPAQMPRILHTTALVTQMLALATGK
ncbi:MAG: hypothetical protein RMJ43_12380 [Chloroherpetonaceae bacterium]|nr:hypothetical protein [Chthonomonadaceae bacterium]MDW8208625.1 hypothetical protein [Chloroherpetonaceae bacterium]